MGKVHQQDELDDDEDEGAHHAKVVPDWGEEGGGQVHSLVTHRDAVDTPTTGGSFTCVKVAIGDEEGSHRDPHQHQELEEPEAETNK